MNIDERLEAVARNLDTLTRIHLDANRDYLARFEASEARFKASEARFEAAEARFEASEERIQAAEERIEAAEERAAAAEERHYKEMAAIRSEIRRAVLLSVREARQERRKRRDLDDKITQLAAAQLVTEEKLQRFL